MALSGEDGDRPKTLMVLDPRLAALMQEILREHLNGEELDIVSAVIARLEIGEPPDFDELLQGERILNAVTRKLNTRLH